MLNGNVPVLIASLYLSSTPVSKLSVQMSTVLFKLDFLLGKINTIDDIFKDVAEIIAEVSNCPSTLELCVTYVENSGESICLNFATISSTVDSHGERLAMLKGHTTPDSCLASTIEEIIEKILGPKTLWILGCVRSTRVTAQDKQRMIKQNFFVLAKGPVTNSVRLK